MRRSHGLACFGATAQINPALISMVIPRFSRLIDAPIATAADVIARSAVSAIPLTPEWALAGHCLEVVRAGAPY